MRGAAGTEIPSLGTSTQVGVPGKAIFNLGKVLHVKSHGTSLKWSVFTAKAFDSNPLPKMSIPRPKRLAHWHSERVRPLNCMLKIPGRGPGGRGQPFLTKLQAVLRLDRSGLTWEPTSFYVITWPSGSALPWKGEEKERNVSLLRPPMPWWVLHLHDLI